MIVSCSAQKNRQIEENNSCQRIVSTAPSITETLFELGMGKNVIGVTESCNFPEEAKNKAKIGRVLDIGSEAVLSLDPDTAFVLSINEPLARKMRSLGIRTVVIDHSSLDGFRKSLDIIQDSCGITGKADALKKKIDSVLSAHPEKKSGKKIMVVVGRDRSGGGIKDAFIVGNDGFLNEIIKLSGADNVFDGNIAYPKIQLEGIIALDPDIVIDIFTDPEMSSREAEMLKKDWLSLPIKAAKSGNVYIKSEDYWTIPGPRFVKIAEEMQNIVE